MNRFATFSLILIWFFILANPLSAETVDRVVANVNGEIITLSSVHERLKVISENVNNTDNANQLKLKSELMKNALNSIIEERLQVQEAKKNGFEVSVESLNRALDELKKNNNVTDQQFEAMLENEGRSIDAYKNVIRDQILVSKIVRMQFGKISEVTRKQIKRYYIQHQKDYWVPPKTRARHILFILEKDASNEVIKLKRSLAQEVLEQIHDGKDFSGLAKKYSEDVSAHLGGDIGTIEQGMMVREFEEAVFRLKSGETSDIVKTIYGLHIIKCDEALPGFSKPLNQVKGEIKSLLRLKNENKAYQKWVKDLRKNAYVDVSLFKDRRDSLDENKNVLKPKAVDLAGDEIFNGDETKSAVKSKNLRRAWGSIVSQRKFRGNREPRDYQLIMKKLKYFKKMRENNKISAIEYQKKKKELLEKF